MRNSLLTIITALVSLVHVGCDSKALKDPPLALTMRGGVLSKYVMQVSNLCTTEGIEVYVYVANDRNSARSGNVVIPANASREFGALEINWQFAVGDRGFVNPIRYGKKLFFKIEQDGKYRSWFGRDDIPEVDVAAQVRAKELAEHEAKLSALLSDQCKHGSELFAACVQANAQRKTVGLSSIWPRSKGDIKERAKDKIQDWKSKIKRKLGKEEQNASHAEKDIQDLKFGSSTEYFNTLLGLSTADSKAQKPYLSGVDIATMAGRIGADIKSAMTEDEVSWHVLANVSDEMSNVLPLFVSSNFPVERLRSFWNGTESADDVIPLAKRGPLGEEAFVVVYRNGNVKPIRATHATLRSIYEGSFNTTTNGYNAAVYYLSPDGVVCVDSTKK